MSVKKNACPNCDKRGGLQTMKEFGKEKVPGSFCKKCSLFVADKQSREREGVCEGCKKKVGMVAELVDVVLDGKIVHRGESPKRIMCRDCSEKRIKNGKHDPDEILTRHESMCLGGCGNLQCYIDAPEGEVVNPGIGYCNDCAYKISIINNEKAIDALAKGVSSTSGT